MPRYKLIIEYDGTRYGGWQVQKNATTVQGALLRAGGELFGEKVDVQGAGRTDAGVHALAQAAHLAAPKALPLPQLVQELNDRLPHDIHILSAEKAHPRFHARHDATGRSYIYQYSRRRTAFAKKYVWWIRDELNVKAMQNAARCLEGMHDFTSFSDKAVDEGKTRVLVEQVLVTEAGPLILLRIRASHFLWKMVRRIAGTLAEAGRGNLSFDDVKGLLENPSNAPSRWTAPPSGLFLEQVLYQGDRWNKDLIPATPIRG